jgi:hypothetical protein
MSMHGPIKERLEDYLRDAPGKKLPPEFEEHLRACEECRETLRWMQEQCRMLRELRPPSPMDPAPGLYARVLERIEAQQKSSIWSVFLDPVFDRRLVAGSLALAVVLGSYLALTEPGNAAPVAAQAETIMVVEEHPPGLGQDRQRDRETILATLASYRE